MCLFSVLGPVRETSRNPRRTGRREAHAVWPLTAVFRVPFPVGKTQKENCAYKIVFHVMCGKVWKSTWVLWEIKEQEKIGPKRLRQFLD